MRTGLYRVLVLTLAILSIAVSVGMCADPVPDKPADSVEKPKVEDKTETKVSISAKDTKLKEVLDSVAKQTTEKLIIESTVKGTIASLELTDVSLESALAAICKAGKIEWRKIYIGSDSKLLEQPDKFAATVRLMSGLSFPDLVLAGSSMNKVGAHFEDKKAVQSAEESALKTLGMAKVYLITNDGAVAAKALEKEKSEKNAAVEKYSQMTYDQMDMFMKMTPEEREQALMAGINLMDQADPAYMSTVMQTLMSSDPENLKRMMNKQMDAFLTMGTDQRRAMMKFQMEAVKSISPEVMKIIQEDSIAIMQELQMEQGGGPVVPAE